MKTMIAASALLIAVTSSTHANLIVNGGFEDGVFLSNIDGHTNEAPVGWTPSPGWDFPEPGFNRVATSAPYAVSIGNDDGLPLSSLSQSFTTISGALYVASFEVANIRSTGFFDVMIDGATQVNIVGPSFDMAALGMLTSTATFADGRKTKITVSNYYQYADVSFGFIGTGSDTLTIAAESSTASYFVGDVDVSLVPEPSGALLGSVGCAVLLIVARSRARPPA